MHSCVYMFHYILHFAYIFGLKFTLKSLFFSSILEVWPTFQNKALVVLGYGNLSNGDFFERLFYILIGLLNPVLGKKWNVSLIFI